MNREVYDVVIIGGGIAGLTASAMFSKLGLDTLCVEPVEPPNDPDQINTDLRTTAFLWNSIEVLKNAEAWNSLKEHAEPLKGMRIIDSGGKNNQIRSAICFDATEINKPFFGCNIPNWITKKTLSSIIQERKNSKIIFGAKVKMILNRPNDSNLLLSNNQKISAKLVIGADGRDSFVRNNAGIKVKKWSNGQRAIVFNVKHEKPHLNISTEIHKSGGPCTLIPLTNEFDGSFRSAVVWMEKNRKIDNLLKLGVDDFSAEVTSRTNYINGDCKLISERFSYPIVNQVAERFYGFRMALIAEAAHVMPPIGAQGLNTSFEDIAKLAELLAKNMENNVDIGCESMLRNFNRQRLAKTKSKILGIDILNKTSASDIQLIKDIRNLGLGFIDKSPRIRKILMQAGLGDLNIG